MKNKNTVTITGALKSALEFNHEVCSEKFYTGTLQIKRLSGVYDEIKIIVSEIFSAVRGLKAGDTVKIEGELRTYNEIQENGTRSILAVFVKSISDCKPNAEHINSVVINGYIGKEPIYRTTPLRKEITDLLIAVNRGYGKSSYIPVIVWGRKAEFARLLITGDRVSVGGRIQSREYEKHLPDGRTVTRTTYELSAFKIEMIKEETEDEKE